MEEEFVVVHSFRDSGPFSASSVILICDEAGHPGGNRRRMADEGAHLNSQEAEGMTQEYSSSSISHLVNPASSAFGMKLSTFMVGLPPHLLFIMSVISGNTFTATPRR